MDDDLIVEKPKTLWGIYIICAVYAFVALVMFTIMVKGHPSARTFAMIMGLSCALLSIGIAMKINVARVFLLILLWISTPVTIMLLGYLLLAMLDVVTMPPHINLSSKITSLGLSLYFTTLMYNYLRRDDVKTAFGVVAKRWEEDDQ